MQSTKLSLGVALLAQLAAGCVSLSTLQTARAVPEGELRPAVGVSVGSVSAPKSQTSLTLPVPEVGLRYGLGGGRDFGIKASPLGSQVEAKQELISSGGFVLALAPALAF